MNEKAVYEIVLKNQKFNDGLKDTEKRLDHFEGSLRDIQNKVTTAFGAGALLAFGNEAYKTSTQLQSLRNSIVFASGSSKEGAENLKFLADISQRMGLDLMATTEGFRTFSGALIGSKFEGQQTRDIFEKISKAVTVMGLSADDAKGVFLALGQMVSKGTVSAEELRGQLGERLPGAFQIAARSLGVTTSKLGDMLKQGEVITDNFLPKFADEIDKTFAKGVAKASESQQADLNALSNKWLKFKDLIGTKIAPSVHWVVTEEKSLTDQLNDQRGVTTDLTKKINPLVERYNQLTRNIFRTSEESEDLKNITKSLSELVPSAVTSWDAYGNAIGFSNEKMREAIRLSATRELELKREASKESQLNIAKTLNRYSNAKSNFELYSRGDSEELRNLAALKKEDLNASLTDLKSLVKTEQYLNGFSVGQVSKNTEDMFLKKGLGGFLKDFLREQIEEAQRGIYSKNPSTSSTQSPTDGKNGKKSTNGVEKIASGTRHVTVNINKLLEVHNQNGAEMLDSAFLQKLQRALLSVVNDVNIVAQ